MAKDNNRRTQSTTTSPDDSCHVVLDKRESVLRLIFAALFTIPILVVSIKLSWHPTIDHWILSQLDNFHLLHPRYSPTAWLIIGLSAPVVLIIAWPIHRAALKNFLRPNMNTLITLGSLSAFGWSIYANITGKGNAYADVAATIILFVITGRFLEALAKRRAGSAVASLLALGSKEVTVIRKGQPVLVSIEHLVVGDMFAAKRGERIATDGIVITGESTVDNSMLTGESMPVEVGPDSTVIGSALNQNGLLVIRATRIGSDTELARITAMVVTAQETKAPIQRLADRISAVFVPVVAVIAIGTFFAWHLTHHSLTHSISSAIAVLVIACPGALGLATPVALLVAYGRGAKRGLVIRQPQVLEVARKINSVVLDKTGTLTGARMLLIQATVIPNAGEILGAEYKELLNESRILSSALSIESQSDHPVAMAVSHYVASKGIMPTPVTDFSVKPGTGAGGRVNLDSISPVVLIGSPAAIAHSSTPFHPDLAAAITRGQGEGLTVSVLAWDGVALAVFAVGDEIKPDAARTIEEFKKRGIDPWMITGDPTEVALAVATEVGIAHDHVIASAIPQQKVELVKTLQKHEYRVLMIGDGIDDAAALATADLSMVMGTGTDTAIATADIILTRRELSSAVDAIDLSNKTLRVIRLNLTWAFAYNVIGIPIAALGAVRPIYAAGAMAVSSLLVVTNSLRIK